MYIFYSSVGQQNYPMIVIFTKWYATYTYIDVFDLNFCVCLNLIWNQISRAFNPSSKTPHWWCGVRAIADYDDDSSETIPAQPEPLPLPHHQYHQSTKSRFSLIRRATSRNSTRFESKPKPKSQSAQFSSFFKLDPNAALPLSLYIFNKYSIYFGNWSACDICFFFLVESPHPL